MLFIFIISSLTAITIAQLKWVSINDGTVDGPPKRRDAGLGYYDNKLVVFGGRGGGQDMDDTWIYDLDAGNWSDVSKPIRPEKRFSFVSGISGQYFYIATGEGDGFFNDVWQFDFMTYDWTRLWEGGTGKDVIEPTTRYGSAGGIFGHRLYVSLGFAGERYGDTFYFDVITKKWHQVGEAVGSYSMSGPHARCLHSGALTSSDELVIYGGCLSGGGTGGPCPSSDTWRLNGEWTQLDQCATPRIYSTMAALPSETKRGLILYGGSEGGKQVLVKSDSPANEVGFYDPKEEQWSLRKVEGARIPSKRASSAMATGVKGIYMFAGSDLNDLWLLEGDTETARKSENTESCNRGFFNLLTLHGIFMFISWGILLQAGAFIARFMRLFKPPFWFNAHRILQVSGILLSIAGFGCGVASVAFDHFKFSHAILGLVIFLLGLQQPLNGLLRPHNKPNEPKTKKRFIWEIWHMYSGRVALFFAIINITLGLYLGVTALAFKIIWFIILAVIIVGYVVGTIYLCKKCKAECTVNNGGSNKPT